MFEYARGIRIGAVIGLLLLAAVPALGQTDIEINSSVQFNFSTPGARSLGLGGAFLGLADDATAAYTNPAGLTGLSRPEVSLEFRSWDYTHVFTDSGNAGTPSGNGVDTVQGLQDGESSDSTSGASFASFVYPGKSWAIAAYRHELANFEANVQMQGAYLANGNRYFPVDANLKLDITGLGLAGAFRFGENFSVGLGLVSYSFDLDSNTDRFDVKGSDPVGAGGFFGPPDYSAGNRVNYQTLLGDDDDIGFHLGFLWTGDKVSVGGVYRQGPEFEFAAANESGKTDAVFQRGVGTFSVPDVYGLGMAIRPTDSFTISFDVNQVTYSDLTANTLNVIGCGEGAENFDCNPADAAASDAAAAKLDVDDATEIHIGLEYVFVNLRYPLALRAGGYHDPDHRIAMVGADPNNDFDTSLAGFFREGDDDFHYSFGFGIVFGEKFQLDAAGDFADRVETFSASGVFRF